MHSMVGQLFGLSLASLSRASWCGSLPPVTFGDGRQYFFLGAFLWQRYPQKLYG